MIVIVMTVAQATAWAQSAIDKLASNKTQITLVDARSRIDKAIDAPVVMGEIMKRLPAEDQLKFLADVNKAIDGMPASAEEKAAKYLNVNHLALKAAKKGNAAALLAEVFATVPPEALTVINERFAIDLVNRAANPAITYTDEQFVGICTNVMATIIERTAETDNGSTRSAFAILMFVRASNGSPADLAEKLIAMLPNEDARELAKNEWIPSALGKDGRSLGYEPLLASADAGRRPDLDFVLVIAGPQYLDSILADIVGKNTDRMSFIRTRSPVLDAVENPLIHQIPTLDGDVFGADIIPQGGVPRRPIPVPTPHPHPDPGPHPHPYQWQSTLGGA